MAPRSRSALARGPVRGQHLPPLNVTPAGAAAVAVGLRMLDGTPSAGAARTALQKLVVAMPPADVAATTRLAGRVRMIVPADLSGAVPAAVRSTVERGEVLRLEYVDRHGAASDRIRAAEQTGEVPLRRPVDLDDLDALGHELAKLELP